MKMKKQFINKELWLLTVGAAFQRANIYNSNIEISDSLKSAFRDELFRIISDLVSKDYSLEISDEKHIKNIWKISEFTASEFPDILTNGRINFGVSQKLLNLYLKYLWCIGEVGTPPHFPVDRIIQQKLKVPQIIAWTKIENEKPYNEIISHARNVLQNTEYSSLAELELNLYQRN